MCLILFAHEAHAGYRLVLAANRDESYARATLPAAFWADAPDVLAGRDLEQSGSWLGVTRSGRYAAVTNYRQPRPLRLAAPSRGLLVGDYLRGSLRPPEYLQAVSARSRQYNGFNLLAGDADGIYYHSNRGERIEQVAPGIHGLSNHLLDTPWPKVVAGRTALADLAHAEGAALIDGLFDTLASRSVAADAALPDSGVGIERERNLSPAFIAAEAYGTRASTVLLIDRAGAVTFIERRFGPMGAPLGTQRHEFVIGA
jgi:uncharacterized protein with NRDE domain